MYPISCTNTHRYVTDLVNSGIFKNQKIHSEMYPISCTNAHCYVTDLVNSGIFKNTKT